MFRQGFPPPPCTEPAALFGMGTGRPAYCPDQRFPQHYIGFICVCKASHTLSGREKCLFLTESLLCGPSKKSCFLTGFLLWQRYGSSCEALVREPTERFSRAPLTGGKPPESGGFPQGVGWDWGKTAYFISSNGTFFCLMRPCRTSDNTVSRSVTRMSRAR